MCKWNRKRQFAINWHFEIYNGFVSGMMRFIAFIMMPCFNSFSSFQQKTVETNHGNVIMSPYSVATALGLLSAGTKGLSFDQIRHGLHLSGDKNTIANEFSESINSLKSKIGDSKLDIANKIYLQTGLQFKTEYKTIAVSKFNSDIETTNFAETEQTANKINHWVEEKTNDRIKNLIEPKALDPVTQLMLVNAIYFKGAWEKPFKYLETTKKPFWTSESHSEEMDFMNKETYFEYGHFDVLESSALKMKYSHSDSSLLILLPDKVMGLTDLEKKLHNVDIKTITGQMRQREIEISIPKFKIEFETEMKETLIKVCVFRS